MRLGQPTTTIINTSSSLPSPSSYHPSDTSAALAQISDLLSIVISDSSRERSMMKAYLLRTVVADRIEEVVAVEVAGMIAVAGSWAGTCCRLRRCDLRR